MITALAILTAAAAQVQAERALGAHEHGHGQLNIAVEGRIAIMELRVPGFDLVGFEHEARTEQARSAVAAALAQLRRPADLFAWPVSAGCDAETLEAALHVEGMHEDEKGHEDHSRDAGDQGDHEGHDGHADRDGTHADEDRHDETRHDAQDGDGRASHSEFHALFRVTCAEIANATAIDLRYFQVFPNAEELDVQIITDTGASAATATRDSPTIDLADAM